MNRQEVVEKDTRTCIRFYDILFVVGFFAALIIAPFLFFFTEYVIAVIIVFVAGVITGNRSYHTFHKYMKAQKELG